MIRYSVEHIIRVKETFGKEKRRRYGKQMKKRNEQEEKEKELPLLFSSKIDYIKKAYGRELCHHRSKVNQMTQ